jgi:hypothetical protein
MSLLRTRAAIFLAVWFSVNSAYGSAVCANEAILKAAQSDVGKKMWAGYGLPNGTLGCAAALSNVLNQAGYKPPHSAAVRFVYKQLRTIHGATEFKLAGDGAATTAEVLAKQTKPGDVLLAFNETPDRPNLGPHAHCGIIGPGGQIYTNDWNDGIWKLAEFQRYFYHYKYFYIFRLPVVVTRTSRPN